MIRIGFITLGCKVNIYESNALKNELMAKGYEVLEAEEGCDAYIINTCSVTNQADAKSRKMIHKCIRMNPSAVICVMGCYSQTNPEAREIAGVDILIGNGNKKSIISVLEAKLKEKNTPKHEDILNILDYHEYEPLNVTIFDHTRAFVKIEDGCENFCTYCIIPYARGPVRCKKADDVIAELKSIADKGYLEVVLAGIHTGRYNDGTTNLSGVIRRILDEVPKLKSLRLSSIEINEIDDDFIKMMGETNVLANHLHLPLQSGSNLILSKMERKYNREFFLEKINRIRNVRPDISITTDVIVGFPYETDEEYLINKKFCEEINFAKIHVFPYSMRSGTKAALMPQVSECVKKQRALDLIELSDKLELEYAKNFINKEMLMIVEQKNENNTMTGHTSNHLCISLPYDEKYLGKMVKIKVIEVEKNLIKGEIMA